MISQDYSKNDYTRKKGIGERIVEALPMVFNILCLLTVLLVLASCLGGLNWNP